VVTDWKRLLALELSAFGFFGLFWGCFAVLLADLSGSLGLSPGPLGVALFVGAGASIAAMGALGWASDRLGRRTYLILATGLFGAGIAGLAVADSFVALLLTLVVLYSFSGLYDVGINAVAVDLERISGRRYMSYLHAAFSGGATGRDGLPACLPVAARAPDGPGNRLPVESPPGRPRAGRGDRSR
jgi:MFS family permease